MFKKLLLLCLITLGSITAYAADLVIAENGKFDYQIVIPDKGKDAIVAFLLVGELCQVAALRLEEKDRINQPDTIDDKTSLSGSVDFVPGQAVDSVEQVDDSRRVIIGRVDAELTLGWIGGLDQFPVGENPFELPEEFRSHPKVPVL